MSQIQLLDSVEDIDAVLGASQSGPVLLFKHSLTCPISARAQEQFVYMTGAPRYALAVQYVREVSQAIAERLEIEHASPQLLVIDNGKVTLELTHDAIQVDAVKSHVKAAKA
jgi:bacillithiol system protein YtxJ